MEAMDDYLIAKNAMSELANLMKSFSDEQRLEIIWELRQEFCFECGRQQTEGRLCQCWNDE